MNKFWFALWHSDEIRGTGAVEASTLPDALRVVSKRGVPRVGDRLEIGMHGFPPARYECVVITGTRDQGAGISAFSLDTSLSWRLLNTRAA
jgi:hypothetical protein